MERIVIRGEPDPRDSMGDVQLHAMPVVAADLRPKRSSTMVRHCFYFCAFLMHLVPKDTCTMGRQSMVQLLCRLTLISVIARPTPEAETFGKELSHFA